MGKHSYPTEAYHVSTARYCLEAFKQRFCQRGWLGRLAMRAGGTAAAVTAAGIALFGAVEYEKAANPEPVLASSSTPANNNEAVGQLLHAAIEQTQEDMRHLMGAAGAFSILAVVGVGLMARSESRAYYETDTPTGANDAYLELPDPDLVEDIGPADTLNVVPAHARRACLPAATLEERSLADDLFDGTLWRNEYA
jgi:hypothetical protein